MELFAKCKNELVDMARERGIYPYFHMLESRQDTVVIMEGQRRIMLGSNNYLGLTIDPRVIQAGVDALTTYGSGCSGSRFLNGTLDMHVELERELAEFLGKEEVVTFSTGFQTNLGIISVLAGKGDYIFCDRENHASIYDGCKLSYGTMVRYKHSDMAELEKALAKIPDKAGKLIVTDGVFSMGGDLAKLPEIVALAQKYGARVMVDDAHGLGVVGDGGRGTASFYGLEDKVDIYMGTFSKSLASLGGYMAASAEVADYVRHSSRPFIFSASMTPASAACALAALKELETRPEIVKNLADIAQYYRDGLTARGIAHRDSTTPIVPVFTYDAMRTLAIAKDLYESGVYVNPVLPPATPANECLLRTSLMATHTRAVVDEALDIMKEVLGRN